MKNTMVIPIVSVTFFLFGWWIYSAFPNGPGFTGGMVAAPFAVKHGPLFHRCSRIVLSPTDP